MQKDSNSITRSILAKMKLEIWGMPVLIFWLWTVLIGIISAITPRFSDDGTGFDRWKDFAISIAMGVGLITLLWVLLARYKRFGIQIKNWITVVIAILTFIIIVGYLGQLILYLGHKQF